MTKEVVKVFTVFEFSDSDTHTSGNAGTSSERQNKTVNLNGNVRIGFGAAHTLGNQ